MEKAGVPLVPGYHGEKQDAAFLEKEAVRIGFPVLIKPSAGGGGKGMRIVSERTAFSSALEASQREARSSFGDERVLVERYLDRPRHIEMQVFGDSYGNVVHLFERDCSVQRRHQKVLEEAPAPHFKNRNQMASAAVAAAKAIGYRGAGTVEFIAEQDGRFYFMEMNTRLQVEHPVTEMITGLDLVEWQLRIASGEKIPLKQEQLAVSGHAIEARIYAEDPRRDFLPATGRLLHLAFPAQNAEVRVDTGVQAGGEITPWYDPMIAKLIVHGRDRDAALARLRTALAEVEIAGVTTNVEFLRKVVASRAFASAELDTGLIERNRAELISAIDLDPFLATAAFAELAHEEAEAQRTAAATGDPHSPWHRVDGWQLNAEAHHDFMFVEGGVEHAVRVRFGDDGPRVSIAGRQYHGKSTKTRAVLDGNDWHVLCDGVYRRLSLKSELAGDAAEAAGSLTAPMSGRIVKVMTKPGAEVGKGEALLILEAMKMEHTITAPVDGMVKTVHYAAGEQVLEGAELVTLE
jgi:3-methylcrotonyl-CoA carboxylase alpha subunit